MIAVVEFKISNLLSTNLISEPDAEASPRFVFGISVVAMGRILTRVLRFLNLLFNIVNGKTKPWYDFVISSLVFHNKMLSKKDTRNQNQMQRLVLVLFLK